MTKPRLSRRTTRLHRFVTMAATLLPLLFLSSHLRAQSALDGFDPNANGEIQAVVVQPDGKILIGGDFTMLSPNGGAAVPRNHIARLNPDGTLDMTFDPNASGDVFAIALQADGKILVGGFFSGANSIGGQTRNRIARLDPVTGLADSFDPNANDSIQAITVQADGKILVGGYFHGANSIGGQTRNFVARLDPTTGAGDSWDPNANDVVLSIKVQADDKVLAGGAFTSIGGQLRNGIARLEATTGLADSWNPIADDLVYSIAIQADGKILVGGLFGSIGGQARNRIARLDATTGLADSFDPHALHSDPGFRGAVTSIAVQADGKILAGGFFTSIGGQTRNHIARLDAMTGMADSLNPNANDLVNLVVVQADDKILVVGGFTSIGGQTRNRIARLEATGRLDQTLDLAPVTGSAVHGTAVQPDGKILIGGVFTNISGVTRNHIARLNVDGTLDPAFNPDANHYVFAIAVQTDGKILVAGDFETIGGQSRNNIARLDPVTGLADSFDPSANGYVTSMVVQADGKILVGGAFTNIGGQTRNYVARLDPITGLADSWDAHADHPGSGGGFPEVNSLAVQTDGNILVGGGFVTIGGQTRPGLARLDPITALADSFDPHFTNGHVRAIAVQADGKILAGGSNLNSGGLFKNLVRLHPNGSIDTSFNPNADDVVFSITVQSNGKILVGGLFRNIGGQERRGLARFDAANGFADSFALDGNAHVNSITVQPDGKILVGGSLFFFGEQSGRVFARLTNDATALQDLAATPTTITWTRSGASPLLARATFEVSTDNANYSFLGSGTPAGSSWTLTGLNLPTDQNIYIRARGYYRGGSSGGSESITESVRNAFIPEPGTLGNISTRLRVQTGDNAMIGGFIITGTEPKTVIVRGIGPSLSLPSGVLADPIIEVHGPSGELLGTNDNWNDSLTRQQIIDSGLAPTNDLESALWGTINPGAYTVVVRGTNGATGIALFEVYDLDQTADSKLANVSTRGFVDTGDNVLIGGAIIIGRTPLRVLLRAIGPSLGALGIPNALEDPTLELYDDNGSLIAVNHDWRDDQEAEIIQTGIPPSNNLESAILRDLVPGNYTAIVRGLNNTTGVALIEAYGLN